eukprot:TRINITY_DN32_c0_g1_i1.p1 TRINITY_DN32_c0_g1~~TRINITY_DN32_c0_g1_i1.p1  ORF type:complete len:479 (+),score=79.79 TRINITY_DN32_c0_g1_i1:96-1532(+)
MQGASVAPVIACLLLALCSPADASLRRGQQQASFLGRASGSAWASDDVRSHQVPPAPAPGLAPGPSPLAPPPPCNWTYDGEGVARPAECKEIPNDPEHRVSCQPSLGGMFPPPTFCTPPLLFGCPPLPPPAPEEAGKPPLLQVFGIGQQHGVSRSISCFPGAVPIDGKYSVSSWGEDWYKGNLSMTAICNNGTWLRIDPMGAPGGFLKPMGFACATREQIKLLRDMNFDEKWTRQNLASAEASHALWLDKAANERKAKLRQAQDFAAELYAKALQQEVPTARFLKKVIDAMRDNFMGPSKGVKRSQQTCQDFQDHFPMAPTASLPHPLVCRYSMQKTPLGTDPLTGKPTYKFRDGCFCESRWKGLCPFRADEKPTYKDFGFETIDERPVTNGMGGPPTGALCWYWSSQLHPEYGYISQVGGGPQFANGNANATTDTVPVLHVMAPSAAPAAQALPAPSDVLMTSPQAMKSAKAALAKR